MRRQLLLSVILLLIGTAFAAAQEITTGSITGQVVDAQGAAVPGATVTITSSQGSKTFVTDNQGRFFTPYLTPGVYTVRVELAGFSPVEQKNINVRLGQRLELPGLVLKVGGLEEVVEVVGAPPVVDISSTTVGGVLDADTLKRVPVGRNFTDALYLIPGVSSSGGVGRANPSVAGASGLDRPSEPPSSRTSSSSSAPSTRSTRPARSSPPRASVSPASATWTGSDTSIPTPER